MNDRKEDGIARTELVAKHYSIPQENIITLEAPKD
jgi:hypothetical protein